jgi:DNA-binding NarL/FixJ family response regulator
VVQQFKHSTPAAPAPFSELTTREKELLALLSKGNSYKMIAREMNISVHTVQQHIKHIYTKMHVHNMGEAVAKAIKNRIV